MSDKVAVCPHCGARGGDDTPHAVAMTRDEMAALLALEQPAGRRRSALSWFTPPPSATAGRRAADITLTIVALPVLACSLVATTLAMLLIRRGSGARVGERFVMRIAVSTAIGVLVTLLACLQGPSLAGVAGASTAALVLRTLLRRIARPAPAAEDLANARLVRDARPARPPSRDRCEVRSRITP